MEDNKENKYVELNIEEIKESEILHNIKTADIDLIDNRIEKNDLTDVKHEEKVEHVEIKEEAGEVSTEESQRKKLMLSYDTEENREICNIEYFDF